MKSKFIFTAFVMAFLTIVATSLKAQDVKIPDVLIDSLPLNIPGFAPRGIFTIPGGGWQKPPSPEAWEASCLDGVTIRTYWKKFNPEKGVYDWTYLDRMFEKANRNDKLIHLMVAPGFYSPKWVLDKVETRKFKVPGGEAPLKGQIRRLPLPWDRKYLALRFAFVDKLAKRYGSNPALSLVAVTGPNGHNGEVNLPDSRKANIDNWMELADGSEENLKEKMIGAYNKTIDHFHKVFARKHGKYFSLQIFERSQFRIKRDELNVNFL